MIIVIIIIKHASSIFNSLYEHLFIKSVKRLSVGILCNFIIQLCFFNECAIMQSTKHVYGCRAVTMIQVSPACTSFHDLVLSQRDKLLNPYFSCRSLRYTTRKSLRQSPEVRVSSAGVHYSIDFPRTKLFFLAHSWHHPAASDPLSIKYTWKTKQCNTGT